jgi:hypothetical protein
MLHVGTSFALFLLQRSAEGVGSNGQFDLVFAIAIGIGLAFDRLPFFAVWKRMEPARVRLIILAMLLAGLIASPRMEFAYVIFSSDYRALAAHNSAIARTEADRLAIIPNPIGCWNLVLCRMAGKAFVWDYFKVSQMVATGAYTSDEIAAMMRLRNISYERIDPRTRTDSLFRRCPMFWRGASQYQVSFSLTCD